MLDQCVRPALPRRSLPVRVAFVIDTIASGGAGTENHLVTLLRKLDRTIVEPYLCVLAKSNWLWDNCRDLAPRETGFSKVLSLHSVRPFERFIRFLAFERILIVESYFITANIVACAAALCLPRVMLVSNRRGQSYSYTLAERLALRALKGRVDLYLANCRATREWASKTEGIPKNKIGVIYNGVDLKRFEYDREIVRARYRSELNLPADAIVIGIVANLRPPKAIDIFLRAARLVSLRFPDAHFVLAGDGPQMSGMVALSRDLGLSDRAHFLGSRDDVARLLAVFDVGVLSSSSESMPNSILEYMAAGLPVVCTDVGGCREAVVHNGTGFLVPPGDPEALAAAILRVCMEGRAESMGARGRARVETMFTFEQMVRRYEQLYTQLAAMGRRELRRIVASGMPIAQEPCLPEGIV